MKSITFHCEVITPMFLAGADGKTPELRPSSIKGALRFWWRALNGHLSIQEMRKQEAEIFGGTYKDEKGERISVKSKIYIETFIQKNYKKFNFLENGRNLDKSIKYFAFTFYHHKDNKDKYAFDTGTKFYVTLKSYDQNLLKKIGDLFYILSLIGGLGMRVRRGLGAFKINSIDSNIGYNLENDYEKIISKISFFTDDKYLNADFNTIQGIFVSNKSFDDWIKALSDISFLMRKVRDYTGKATTTKFKLKDLGKKAAFGLPIPIFGDKNNKLNLFKDNEEFRRASQFYISIFYDNQTNKYKWSVALLNGKFKPEDMLIKYKNYEYDVDYELYYQFVNLLE